jgi:hypothetical protein
MDLRLELTLDLSGDPHPRAAAERAVADAVVVGSDANLAFRGVFTTLLPPGSSRDDVTVESATLLMDGDVNDETATTDDESSSFSVEIHVTVQLAVPLASSTTTSDEIITADGLFGRRRLSQVDSGALATLCGDTEASLGEPSAWLTGEAGNAFLSTAIKVSNPRWCGNQLF